MDDALTTPAPLIDPGVTRRMVVAGTGAAMLSVTVLSGCQGSDNADGSAESQPPPAQPASSPASTPSEESPTPTPESTPTPEETDEAEPTGTRLGPTSDVPIGGGRVYEDQEVVVTQPEEGTFKAFSAVCTHEGCIVAEIAGGTINCPCHGSQFDVSDASVVGGPAPEPLPAAKITVADGTIALNE